MHNFVTAIFLSQQMHNFVTANLCLSKVHVSGCTLYSCFAFPVLLLSNIPTAIAVAKLKLSQYLLNSDTEASSIAR